MAAGSVIGLTLGVAGAVPISDIIKVTRANGEKVTMTPKTVDENAGVIGNDCTGRDECSAKGQTKALIEGNAKLDAWWQANKDANGDATAQVFLTEPTFFNDADKGKISDLIQVEVHKNPAEFLVTIKLFSDPQDNFKFGLNEKDVRVEEIDGPLDIKDKFPGPVADLFSHITVTSDAIVALSGGDSVIFNSVTSSLSFANDLISLSISSDDPIIGSAVDLPTFLLDMGTLGSVAISFTRSNDALFTLRNGSDIYMKAQVDSLSYDPAGNAFIGRLFGLSLGGVAPGSPFFDSSLSDIDSPFLQALDSVLDPGSPQFDPLAAMFIQYQPDIDFFAATEGFTASADSPITNFVYKGTAPEPPSLLLVAMVIAALGLRRGAHAFGGCLEHLNDGQEVAKAVLQVHSQCCEVRS